MPDEPFAISPSAPPPPTEADYEAIHAAVMETVRGRWFLAEFSRRNRHADTALVLAAIDRVEALWRERRHAAPAADRLRFDLVEMAKAIAQTRTEIAAMRPDGDHKGSLSEASEELDSIVRTTAQATSDILAAAEQVQEIAWTLREHGADQQACDALDRRATDIYTACSFQDLTGQRIGKVVEVLRFLEERIRAMIDIWGDSVPAGDTAAPPHLRAEVGRLGQPDIDRIMPASSAAAPPLGNGHDTEIVAARTVVPTAGRDEVAAAGDVAPAGAIVGATALALDPLPAECAPQPVHALVPQPEIAQATGPALASASAQPEPFAESAAEPALQRNDPATLLKRILALIRAPEAAPPPVVVEARATEPEEIPVEAVAVGAVATIAVAELPARRAAAPSSKEDDRDDDILMPLSGPLTVDQAVDQLLGKTPARPDVMRTRAVPPTEPGAVPELEFAATADGRARAEPTDAPRRPTRAAMGAPEPATTPEAAMPPPAVVELVPEPVAEVGSAPPPDPAPEPLVAPTPTRPQESAPGQAIRAARVPSETIRPDATFAAAPPPPSDEPPPVNEPPPTAQLASSEVAITPRPTTQVAPAPVDAPAPAAAAQVAPPAPTIASAPMPAPTPVPPPAKIVAAAAPPPRHPALAALASLSDVDKIALFS